MNSNSKIPNSSFAPLISKYYWIYFVISLVFLIPGMISLGIWGLRPGIDFSGGTILEFSTTPSTSASTIREIVPKNIPILDLQPIEMGKYSLRLPPLIDDERRSIIASLSATIPEYKENSLTAIGPTIGQELVKKTATAVVIAALLIAVYLGLRFQSVEYGVSAVVATLHDVLILLGVFSLLGHFAKIDVDSLFVTALLTIVSFSVHDTVVVYDRIRERKKRYIREHVYEVIDSAVRETLTRSLRNSLAVIIVLSALILLGGETLRWFAVALLIGTISGTYSSTFVALPLLVIIEKIKEKFLKK